MKRLSLFLLTAMLTASCGLYGRFEGVSSDIDAAAAVGDAPVSTAVVLPWREVFSDPVLLRWIDTALVHNTDILKAAIQVQKAEVTLRQSRLVYVPTLQAGASAEATKGGSSTALSLSSGWEADLFGRLLSGARGAEADLAASQESLRWVRASLVSAVADSYLNLLMLDSQLSISDKTLETWDKTISVLEALKLAGKTNDIAVLQAKARKMNLESSSLHLRSLIAQAGNDFCALVGIPRREVGRGSLDSFGIAVPTSDGSLTVPLEALASRPDVLSAEQAVASAYYGVNAARASLYPSLSLSGSGWSDGKSLVDDPKSIVWTAAASLTQPIFNGGKARSAVKLARARQEEASLTFRQTLLDAGSEVCNALAACSAAADRIEVDGAQRSALSQAVGKIELMMRYSTTNYLEVLTAQQSLLEAELGLISDRTSLLSARIALFRALGGGAD